MARFGLGWWLKGRFSPPMTDPGAGGGAAAIYPIADVGGDAPEFAYGVTKLDPAYAGSALRVVRVSDSATLDVGFVGSALDIASLDAFLGATTGQVDILYIQDASGDNATQTSAGIRPLIDSGTVAGGPVTIGGHRAIIFPSGSYMNLPSGIVLSRQAANVFVVAEQFDPGQGNPIQLGSGTDQSSLFCTNTYVRMNPGTTNLTVPRQVRPNIFEGGLGVGVSRIAVGDEGVTGTGTTNVSMVGGMIGNTSLGGGYTGEMYMTAAIGYARYFSTGERTAMQDSLSALYSAPLTATARVVFDGDSITAGNSTSSPNYFAYVKMTTRALDPMPHIYNYAGGGQQLQNKITSYSATGGAQDVIGAYSGTRILLMSCGTNDFNVGLRTDVQLEADVQNYAGQVRADGGLIIVSTVLPATGFDAGREAYRVAYNTWLRANWASFADGLCDFAADPIMGAANAEDNATLYPDGLHPSRLGHTYLAPIAAAAIEALL